ncbi:hypothetical protein [Bacteroides sp.]|uniref:hypothetical protein n=1 Tax=Bacteroides sp. TaxID=29523 RepID=UPI00260A4766|nr:hypothetical protein [Bacteroides sp.]MDD3040421.1 hypothetical protein [Bacteroides sp.]
MFRGILMLASDSPEQLRKCDVYRVLAAAKEIGSLKEFSDWLKTQSVSTNVKHEINKLLVEEFSI